MSCPAVKAEVSRKFPGKRALGHGSILLTGACLGLDSCAESLIPFGPNLSLLFFPDLPMEEFLTAKS